MSTIPTRGQHWDTDPSAGLSLERYTLVLKSDGFFYATTAATAATAGVKGVPAKDAEGFVFGLTNDESTVGYTVLRSVLKPDRSVEAY